MVELQATNVLIKPSQRRRVMGWLRRVIKLGQRLGGFLLQITLHRVGRQYEVQANVKDSAGSFHCRLRMRDWREAVRDLAHRLYVKLHQQQLALG